MKTDYLLVHWTSQYHHLVHLKISTLLPRTQNGDEAGVAKKESAHFFVVTDDNNPLEISFGVPSIRAAHDATSD